MDKNNKKMPKGRSQKARRFRDRENSGSQALWTLIATLQAVMIAIFSIGFTSDNISTNPYLLGIVFILGITTMTILVILAAISRDIDSRIAAYYEIIKLPRSERPDDFDAEKVETKNKDDLTSYHNWRMPLEAISFFALVANMVIFWIAVVVK